MGITIKEIAALAGCSRGTVDRALRNSPKIKAETKAVIMKIVEEYGYKPNLAGQALAMSKKPYNAAVIINSRGNDFFDEIKRGLRKAEQEFSVYGICLNVIELERFSAEKQLAAIDYVDEKGYEALIISAVDNALVAARLQAFTEGGKTVITVNSDTDFCGKLTYIGCDYIKSGRTAGGLISLVCDGYPNELCLINGSSNVLGHKQRIEGITEIVGKQSNIKNCGVIECDDNETDAYNKVKAELIKHENITVICGAAGGVVGAEKAVCELNRKVKIIAFDNTEKINALLREGKLSATINQQPYEQGYLAVKTLYEFVFAKLVPPPVINTELTIVIKENL